MAVEPIHPTKVCNKCGVEKPQALEYFRCVTQKGRVYFRGSCRQCELAYTKRWFKANQGKSNDYQREYRQRNLERVRERDRIYYQENIDAKREQHKKRWAKADKQLAAEKLRQWKATNPEKQKAIDARRAIKIKTDPFWKEKQAERQKRYRERHRERVLKRQRAAYRANPDKANDATRRWRRENPDKARGKDRAYRQANPEKVIAAVETRRARMLNAEGEFTGHDVVALLKTYGRVCFYCDDKIKKFNLDHFIPLARGGTNWPDNLVISCRPCNLSKAAKMPWEWMPERFSPGCTPR